MCVGSWWWIKNKNRRASKKRKQSLFKNLAAPEGFLLFHNGSTCLGLSWGLLGRGLCRGRFINRLRIKDEGTLCLKGEKNKFWGIRKKKTALSEGTASRNVLRGPYPALTYPAPARSQFPSQPQKTFFFQKVVPWPRKPLAVNYLLLHKLPGRFPSPSASKGQRAHGPTEKTRRNWWDEIISTLPSWATLRFFFPNFFLLFWIGGRRSKLEKREDKRR